MKKNTKRRRLLRVICAVLLAAVLGTGGVLFLRPDIRFEARQASAELLPRSAFTEVEPETKSVPVSEYQVERALMLVNREHPLGPDFCAELAEYKDSGVLMSPETCEAYGELSAFMKERFGESLYVMSSYRSAEEQTEIEARQGSDTAMPAECSEHQTGMALDVYFQGFAGRGIIKCEPGRYLNEHCSDFGFIIRYPLMKKSETGIEYEPWHIRYLGQPHAKLIAENHLTLEEYFDRLEDGKFYEYSGYIISRQKGEMLNIPKGVVSVSVSDDNCGGYVITAKMS